MRNINRRESPRIEIKLRCHVTSPALWMRSAMYTENISRSGLLVAWRGEGSALPMPVDRPDSTVEIELPANHGFGQKCIHCQGTVIARCRPIRKVPRVALRVNYMDFRSFHDRMRVLEAMQPVVKYAGWLKEVSISNRNGSQFAVQVAAVVHGLRLPHADGFSVRAHGRGQDAAGRLRHRAGTSAPANGSWPTAGSGARYLLVFQSRASPGSPGNGCRTCCSPG